jgi:succinoglycan biosynthesis transport protein ExoP
MQESGKFKIDYLTLNVHDCLNILRRRKLQLLVPMTVLILASIWLAFSLPPVYQSSAMILIEVPEVPPHLVRSSESYPDFANQRIQVLTQRILTNYELKAIIEKFNLYPDERQINDIDLVVDQMRSDILVEAIVADADEGSIVFTVSYESESPELAQQVANELAPLYLKENVKFRKLRAAETSEFLGQEADRLSTQISALEARLATFKGENVERLPELANLNLQMMNRTDDELRETERQMQLVRDRKIYLESQLAQISPDAIIYSASGERIATPVDRLRALQAQYASAASLYALNHPDLVRMRREIEGLTKEVGGTDDTSGLQGQLAQARAELVQARETYSEEHPDVKRLKRTVANLEEALKTASASLTKPLPTSKPDNPAYIQIKTQLEAADAELASLQSRQKTLQTKLASYEQRIYETPGVEREYLTVTRDYKNLLETYHEIKAKQMEAQLTESREREQKGERFSLIEPAGLPAAPVKPNRAAILFLGVVFSLGGGVGAVALREITDDTVQDAKGIAAMLGAPPLVGIPYIENKRDVRRRILKIVSISVLIAGGIVLGGLFIHFNVMSLQMLWASAVGHLGLQSGMAG